MKLNFLSSKKLISARNIVVYHLVSYLFVLPLFRILFRGRIFGKSNVPKQGPLVVVANHGSHLDPPFLGHALGRQISFMAKEELFRIPLLGIIINACGAYPVSRGSSDRESIRLASSMLNKECATGLFLDGTRQKDGRVNHPMAGAAFLAARTGAALLPVAIINSHRAFGKGSILPRFVRVHIRVGEKIPPPKSRKKDDLQLTTERLKVEINAMLDKGLLS